MELEDLLDAVKDRESFLVFVEALRDDRRAEVAEDAHSSDHPYAPGARGWENSEIETFLDSAASWARGVARTADFRAEQFPETASWAVFARFLYAGKIYE